MACYRDSFTLPYQSSYQSTPYSLATDSVVKQSTKIRCAHTKRIRDHENTTVISLPFFSNPINYVHNT
jgi:hypothetical protein